MREPCEFEKVLNEMTKTSFGRRSFLAAIPLLVAACASSPKRRTETELTIDDEKMMAREALPELQRDYPALRDAEVQKYISDLGTRLTKSNALAGNPYDYVFTVVDAPLVNAFALPAGRIFVTASLLKSTETEAELAGVLGHEIGHVVSHHAAQRIIAQRDAKEQSWWYGVGGALSGAGAASALCSSNTSFCSELIAMGVSAGIQGGLLIQKYQFLANNQENELEADRVGFDIAIKANYAADYIGAFYSRLQKFENPQPSFKDAMQTHPPSQERVQQMKMLASQRVSRADAVVSSSNYEKIKRHLS